MKKIKINSIKNKDDNITNEKYHIIETYRNLSDDLKMSINIILQIDI